MGHVDAVQIDVAAVLRLAGEYDATADTLADAARHRLTAFDGATAGRAYTHYGDAVRVAADELSAPLGQWARATHEIAATLRASADRYLVADADASGRLG